MNRRNLLISVSAVAIATALPTSVFATPYVHIDSGAPIAKLELIEDALDAADELGFDIRNQAELFGFEPNVDVTTPLLRDMLYDFTVGTLANLNAWNRMRYVVAIHQQLDLRCRFFSPSYLLDARLEDSEYTMREQMLYDRMGMQLVASRVGCDVAEHSFGEMRAFG